MVRVARTRILPSKNLTNPSNVCTIPCKKVPKVASTVLTRSKMVTKKFWIRAMKVEMMEVMVFVMEETREPREEVTEGILGGLCL